MRVKEIVIDGFKSYAKRTVIAQWDKQFNCITGLNGSGKSNILDAICFVLGITSMSTVRAQNQQDLIYKRGQAGVTKASVSIVFDNTDTSKSPLDYRDAPTITVTRQVVLGGTSKYLINGHRAQQAQVQQLFQEVQLNVNNPNFLIMQGQITKVLNMRPTEILSLIEEAAGTGMYEKERVRAVKEINDRDAPLHETEALLNEEVKPKLEILRKQKRDFLQYQQYAASAESLERIVLASQYLAQSKQYDLRLAEESQYSKRHEELKVNIETLEQRQLTLQEKMKNLKSQNVSSEQSNQLEREIQNIQEEQAKILISLDDKKQQLAKNESDLKNAKSSSLQLKQQLENHQSKFGVFEEEHAKLKEMLERQSALVTEKRELLSGLQTGISTTGDKEIGYAYLTKKWREQALEINNQITKLESRKAYLQSTVNSSESSHTKEQAQEQRNKLSEVESKKNKMESQIAELSETANEIKTVKQNLEDNKNKLSRVNRDIDMVLRDFPNLSMPREMQFDKVRGRLVQNFTIKEGHENKAKALEGVAGGELWSMIVDDTSTAEKVLSKAHQRRLYVLPMDKIRGRLIGSDVVKQIDSNGAWRAYDLISFDKKFDAIMQYAFGSTVVCATADIAKRAAFKFKINAITLEGDVFEPRGIISGGSDGRLKGGVFAAASEFSKLENEKRALDSEISELQTKLANHGNIPVQLEQLRSQLGILDHEAKITRTRLDELETKLNENSNADDELNSIINKEIPKLKSELKDTEESLQKSIKDASDFTNNRDSKLKQLKKEVESAEAEEKRIAKEISNQDAAHANNQAELARINTELEQEKDAITNSEKAANENRKEIDNISNHQIPDLTAKLSQLQKLYDAEISKVSEIRTELQKYESEFNESEATLSDLKVEVKQVSHDLSRAKERSASAKSSLHAIQKKNPQASELVKQLESQGELVEGHQLAATTQRLANEQKLMKELAARVDTNVVGMVERLETDEVQLRQRIDTIRNDKVKLGKSMATLNERRRKTIDTVWRQVSKEFGLIFGDLLPGSSCELVPVNNKPIEEGFSIRVRLGTVWKDGLTELSGGQRSLVALSLILSLLKYHPAPMYILDEVDAALDVHHTRNIGHIIKTRFKNAQFIVVSLKDDMFTNANRIFQTRFIDGTSTVQIMA